MAQEIDRKIVQKKTFFSVKKKDFAFFFLPLQRKTDTKEQSIKVHKGVLTKIVQVKSLNPKNLRGRLKQTFQKKTCTPVDKSFCPFSLVFPEYDRIQGTIN